MIKSNFTFQATVFLAVNVAFLAIQSVDIANPYRSPVQISSYSSVIANSGSIALGLLLMRQNRTKSRDAADAAVGHFRLSILSYLQMHAKAGIYCVP
jgi:hypothetical protein